MTRRSLVLPSWPPGEIPGQVHLRCPHCGEDTALEELRVGLMVCPWCEFHFPWEASSRLERLVDEGSFAPLPDLPPSPNRVGRAALFGQPVAVAVTDYTARWGPEEVGALLQVAEVAFQERRPLLWVLTAAQGGPDERGVRACWMALSRLAERKVPWLVLVAGPCYGPLAALALRADLLFAERGSALGLLLPEALREAGRLPPECADHPRRLLQAGWADNVVTRREQRAVLAGALDFLRGGAGLALRLPGRGRGLFWDLPAPLGQLFGPALELHGDRGASDAPGLRAGLARLQGEGPAVLLLAAGLGNRSLFGTGRRRAIGSSGWRKAARLVRLAGRFELPVIGLVGNPELRPELHEPPGVLAAALAEFQEAWLRSKVPTLAVFLQRTASPAAQAFGGADRVLAAAEAAGAGADAMFADEPSLSRLLVEGVQELIQTYLLSGPLGRRKLLERRGMRLSRALQQ